MAGKQVKRTHIVKIRNVLQFGTKHFAAELPCDTITISPKTKI